MINNNLQKYAQIISRDMMEALVKSADMHGINLELEIATRLSASFSKPKAFGIASMLHDILNYNISNADAIRESNDNRQKWLMLYEMDKLRLLMQFESKLPKSVKENFVSIDIKAARRQIEAELNNSPTQE